MASAPGVATGTLPSPPRPVAPLAATTPARRPRWWRRPALVRPALIYLASRLLTSAAIAVSAPIAHLSYAGAVDRWDTRWFLRAAAYGYPSHLPTTHGHVAGSPIAFFPLFPLATRALSVCTGTSLLLSGVTLSMVSGLSAMVALWSLVRRYAGDGAADRATALAAFFPASFVFSLAYAEGIVITFVALGLLALGSRRFVLAGLAGAVASAASPVALAFEVSCLWVAVSELRRTRRPGVLAAPVLAPAGFVAYQAWLWAHTGNLMAWKLTERGGWKSYLSPAFPVHLLSWFVTHPVTSTANENMMMAGTAVAVIGVVLALRQHQPAALVLFGATAAAVAFLTAPVGVRPRFVLDAFPLVAAIGVRLQGRSLRLVLAASALGLVACTYYAVGSYAVFP